MSGEQQTQEKMVPMSAIEQACRDVFLDKTSSTVAHELHGNMPGIAYYAIWRRCHEAAAAVTTKEQTHTAFWSAIKDAVDRQHPIGRLTRNELDTLASDFLQRLFPEEAPTDANLTGGAHA